MKQVNKSGSMGFSLLIIIIITFSIDKSLTEEFTYRDAQNWPQMYPQCGGQRQSPVHFTWDDFVEGDPDDYVLMVNYSNKPLSAKLMNDGHALKVLFEWDENQTPYFTGGILGQNEYVLDSMHFHWRRRSSKGAEHCLNKQCFRMEMQIVHYNRNYGNFENALNFTDGLIVYAATLDYMDGTVLRTRPISYILSNAESVSTPGSSVDITPFSMNDINPYEVQKTTFLAYLGSLTTPPCTENVLWLWDGDTLYIRKSEAEFLQRTVEFIGQDDHNIRPAQPSNGRKFTFLWGISDVRT